MAGIGLSPMVKRIAMVSLFSIFIFNFVFLFLSAYNPSSQVFSAKYGLNNSISNLTSSINDFSNTSNSVFSQLSSDKPTSVNFIFLIFKGAYYVPVSFLSFVWSSLVSIKEILFISLGGAGLGNILAISLSTIMASILITITLLIVKAIRTGESER